MEGSSSGSLKWIGCKIRKVFAEGTFEGEVVAVEREVGTKKLLCNVLYTDGDREDLYLKELKEYIVERPKEHETVSSDENLWAKGYGEDKSTRVPVFDYEFFVRNPCRLQGGIVAPPDAYPGSGKSSYLHMLRCLSDRNYAMREFCTATFKNPTGARYATYSALHSSQRIPVWLPRTNLDEHAKTRTIVDGFHAHLIDPKNGQSLLTGDNLEDAMTEGVECLFVNRLHDSPATIVRCIEKSRKTLLCLSLVDCTIDESTLRAIGTCSNLRGLILSECNISAAAAAETRGSLEENTTKAADAALAASLTACPRLRWLLCESRNCPFFFDACWTALEADSCPLLQILWVETIGRTVEKETAGYRLLTSGTGAVLRQLRLCMINPDKKLNSEFLFVRRSGRGS